MSRWVFKTLDIVKVNSYGVKARIARSIANTAGAQTVFLDVSHWIMIDALNVDQSEM